MDDNAARPVNEIIETQGVLHERGPGIQVWRAPAEGDPVSALFAIEIWGKLRLHAGIYPVGLDAQPRGGMRLLRAIGSLLRRLGQVLGQPLEVTATQGLASGAAGYQPATLE